MSRKELKALEIAREITVAKASNSSVVANKENGELYGDFFQAIYKKVLEITQSIPD